MVWKFSTVLIFLVLLPLLAFGRKGEIRGRVLDENNAPMIGANVYLEGTVLGSATNGKGEFLIQKVPPGNFTLVITVIGYEQLSLQVTVIEGQKYDIGTESLNPSAISGNPVVVTAGKYEQKIQDVPASLNSISSRELAYRNTITIDNALEYVPGVNLNGGQINIRGSSGFSLGVGSRVLFLLDGVPLLTGDTRDIIYEAVPTYLVERIEVLKGAGSALYGSSALGGVINVLTPDIEQAPRIYAKIFGGIYAEPVYQQWKWSNRNRYLNGIKLSYSQKIKNAGFFVGGSRDEDDGYRENDWRKRSTVSGKFQWNVSPFQKLTLIGNYMYQKRGNFLNWEDLNNALRPPLRQRDDEVLTRRYYITGNYRYIFSEKQFLTVRGLWYKSRFDDTVSEGGGNESSSAAANGEIQFNSQFGKLFLTAGVEGNWNSAKSDIFGDRSGVGTAAYLQGEVALSEKWRATLGLRYDYFDMDSIETDSRLNPKVGLVFKPLSGLAVRGAFGLGFRAPSMAEAFTSTTANDYQVIPNTDLKAEKSYYIEFGANRLFGSWLVGDLALFYNRFEDFIEGTFLPTLQIQFQNLTNARVRGIETQWNGRFIRNRLNLGIGYTYVDARNLDTGQYLNFRPRHLLYTNAQLRIWELQTGIDYRYISKYDRIDERFALLIPDAEERVDTHLVDLHVAADFKLAPASLTASLHINNLLNYYYVDMVGSLAPLRNIVLTLETDF
jgi:iron complex outermembrane receptor protein